MPCGPRAGEEGGNVIAYISNMERNARWRLKPLGICIYEYTCCFRSDGKCHRHSNPRCEMRLSVREAVECRRERR